MSDTPAIQPRTAVITIYGGDYLDRIRHLERLAEAAKDDAEDQGPRINSDVPEYLELARQHDDLVREAEASALHVRVRALGRREWKALVAEHPPRVAGKDGATEDQAKSDALSGVNDETFKDALVAASVIEPEGITPEDLDQLADIDYDRIYLRSFALNRGAAPDPKASLVSRLTQKNDETSS
jgi:hypothetical protein